MRQLMILAILLLILSAAALAQGGRVESFRNNRTYRFIRPDRLPATTIIDLRRNDYRSELLRHRIQRSNSINPYEKRAGLKKRQLLKRKKWFFGYRKRARMI